MKLYECTECGDYYYKMVEQCPYCNCVILIEINGTEEEVIFSVLREINTESEEYEQFNYESLKEKVDEKLNKKKYKWESFDNALKEACKMQHFTEMTFYISSA